MQNIILTDRKHKRQFTLTGPAAFDELTSEQLIAVIRAKREFKDEFLQALLIADKLFRIGDDRTDRLTTLQKLQLASTVEFAFEPVVKMNKWLIRQLPGTKLYGPNHGLDNITFEELMFADQKLDAYKNTEDEQALNELVAVLFRPKKFWPGITDDIRKSFNQLTIEKRAHWIGKYLDLETRLAVRFNYVACRSRMSDFFRNLFPEPDDEVLKENKPASNDNWLDIAIDLARKEPVLGTVHQIEKDNAYLVLKVLDRIIKEYHQQKEELEAIR